MRSSGQLVIGIVGCAGRGGSYFAPFQADSRVRIAALCDINEEGLQKAAADAGGVQQYTVYEQMLDEAGLDAVVIGTPMPLHTPQAVLALERDISVMSEVPASVSIEKAEALVRAEAASRGSYMMAENDCYIRENVLVRAIARTGLFGELYFGEGEYTHELKGLNEMTTWRRKWQTGINGVTYGTHSLGPVLQWMNERVVSVSCTGTGHHYRDAEGRLFENEDSVFMLCRMEKGGLVKIRVDMLSNRPHNMVCYSLQGTKGCYESGRGFGDVPRIWLDARIDHFEWMPLSDFEEEFLPAQRLNPPRAAQEATHWGADYWQVREFIDALADERKPDIGIHEAMDMTLPGLVSQQSILRNSAWMEVPDSRTWVQTKGE